MPYFTDQMRYFVVFVLVDVMKLEDKRERRARDVEGYLLVQGKGVGCLAGLCQCQGARKYLCRATSWQIVQTVTKTRSRGWDYWLISDGVLAGLGCLTAEERAETPGRVGVWDLSDSVS